MAQVLGALQTKGETRMDFLVPDISQIQLQVLGALGSKLEIKDFVILSN